MPPIEFSIVGVHVHEVLSALFPEQQSHREGESRDAEHEEGERPASEDAVDAGGVEQEDEDDGLEGDTAEHVLVEC